MGHQVARVARRQHVGIPGQAGRFDPGQVLPAFDARRAQVLQPQVEGGRRGRARFDRGPRRRAGVAHKGAVRLAWLVRIARHQDQARRAQRQQLAGVLPGILPRTGRHPVHERVIDQQDLARRLLRGQPVQFRGGANQHRWPFHHHRIAVRVVELPIRVAAQRQGHIVPVPADALGGHFDLLPSHSQLDSGLPELGGAGHAELLPLQRHACFHQGGQALERLGDIVQRLGLTLGRRRAPARVGLDRLQVFQVTE